jgi:ribosomal protein S18 acetylase RimI-like enzyme
VAESDTEIVRLGPEALAAELDGLTDVLHASVHAGASVGFVLPFPRAAAAAFWRDTVAPAVHGGARRLWIVRRRGATAGTVQLVPATPPNQPHRAEVTKLLVHPDHRRQGLARALMAALEAGARDLGRSLITLDTRTGDPSHRLYRSLGYRDVGELPGWSLNPHDPEKRDPTTFLYKTLPDS